MTLENRIILEMDVEDSNGETHTGVFPIREDLNITGEISRKYLMSNRGSYLRKIYDVGTDLLPEEVTDASLEDRKGYYVDGGAGRYSQTFSGVVAYDEDPWGDGSSNEGESNKWDASGTVSLTAKKQVFEWYIAQVPSDSRGLTRAHYGGWTDGTYSDSAGVFESPMPVAIPESSVANDPDNPSALEITLECEWTALFPDNVIQSTADAVSEIADQLPDY
jgi:hypothetical protein